MKGILITGATSGIGMQLAKDYAKQGIKVLACGRNDEALQSLKDYSTQIYPLQFDVTDYTNTMQVLGELPFVPDTWIFNAGDCEYFEQGVMEARVFKRILDVNVIGVANCIEGCQKYFRTGHRLVMVASVAAEVALPRAEAYGASKAALSYLARSLSVDLKPKGVQVVCVYPGFVATPLTDRNTFPMPMRISVKEASNALRSQLEKGKSHIFFPAGFTLILRFIALLPYSLQRWLASKLIT